MKRPLVALAISFGGGIIASGLKIPLFWLYSGAAILLLLIVFLFKKGRTASVLLVALVFFGGMIWAGNYRIIPRSHILRFHYSHEETYALRGWVDSEVKAADGKTSFLFRLEEIASGNRKQPSVGKLQVIVRGKVNPEYGQELILEGKLQRPYGDYFSRHGIFRLLRVRSPDFLRYTGANKGNPFKRRILKLKSRIESGFENNLSPVGAGIIEAMTIGEEKNVPARVYKDMVRSGTVHILVVSGSNVGVVAFIIVLLLKTLRIRRSLRLFFCVPLLLGYCILTGASNPVVRATIMAIVFLFSYLARRDADVFNSCAASSLFILIFDPTQLFDIGFQLSFASVLAIAFFYPRLKVILRVENLKIRWLRFSLESCLVSLSAWLGTAGFIAAYFRMVSPVTVLANMLIVPLAGLVTLSGFSLLAAQCVSAYLSSSFVPVNEFLINLLLALNSLLLCIPHAYFYF